MISDLNEAQIEEILEEGHYGHVGCYADEEVYVVPVTYAYRDKTIYSYTHEGKKTAMMNLNPKVCFQTEVIKAPQNWRSVICWGTFEEITDPDEKRDARKMIATSFARASRDGEQPHSPLIEELSEHDDGSEGHFKWPILYRIKITKMTGKAEIE